jgi:hypothetical protein
MRQAHPATAGDRTATGAVRRHHLGVVAIGARLLATAAVVSGIGAGSLLAQATGKLEGRVRDRAGAPVANAQVFILGTAFSALTNPDGYYFINNVQPGTVVMRAAFIGYKSTVVEGVRVLADQTGTVDIQLEQTTVRLEEILVVSQTQPLVPRDEVTTKQRVDGQLADELPVDRIEDVLQLQPGVLQDTDGGLSIRGGRETQNVTYVDGVPVQAGYRGDRWTGALGTSIIIGTNALEEASVTTGSSSAEFGNATAGIISIVTKTGGTDYQGSVSLESDEPFGVNHGPGFNRVEGSFSGPLAGRLTFALSGTLEGQKAVEEGFNSQNVPIFLPVGVDTTFRQPSALKDDSATVRNESLTADTTVVDVYRYAISRGRCNQLADAGSAGMQGADSAAIGRIRNNYGLGCNGVRVPATARTLHSISGKLNYTYGTGSRIALSAATSRSQGHFFQFVIGHLNSLAPPHLRGFSNRSRLATLDWIQNLSRSAERTLGLYVALSYQQDRVINSPLTSESDLATRDPFGGFLLKPMKFLFDFDNFPIDDQLIQNFRRYEGRISPHDLGNTSYAILDNLRNDAYGLYGVFEKFDQSGAGDTWAFGESGGPQFGRVNLYREDRYLARTTLDWQADRYQRFKLGGEFTLYAIDNYTSQLQGRSGADAYIETPLRWNAFVEDRLDLGDVVVVGGLRYDWYDTRASRPFATDTAGNRYPFPSISTAAGFDPTHPSALFVRDRSHGYLSPHVQVSFPVTDRTNFRLSYSHQVQEPDFGLLLGGINIDGNQFGTDRAFGSDLDFGKTIAFEFGVRHALSDDMVLDVAAYNKNIIADPAARLVTRFDPVRRRDVDLTVLTNQDFGTVRGVDVRLDRRFGNFFNGTIAYSYQYARNTGSDPFSYIFFGSRIVNQVGGINGAQPPPQASLPTDDSRPHALTGAFSIAFPGDWKRGSILGTVLQNVGVFSTFRYTSGTAYSQCGESTSNQSSLSGDGCDGLFPEGLNTRRLPAFKELNARFTKSFGVGRIQATGYLDVRNLLNFKNVLRVFGMNGGVRNDVERAANLAADLGDLKTEGERNNALAPDGSSLKLGFRHEQCAIWVSSKGSRPAAANCLYLIRAEQRFGDGDGVFTLAEQSRAINALYDVARGEQEMTAPGRRARLGIEVDF